MTSGAADTATTRHAGTAPTVEVASAAASTRGGPADMPSPQAHGDERTLHEQLSQLRSGRDDHLETVQRV